MIELREDTLYCSQNFDKNSVPTLLKIYKSIYFSSSTIHIDLSKVTYMDSAGAMFLLKIQNELSAKNKTLHVKGASLKIKKLLTLCQSNNAPFPHQPKEPLKISKFLYRFGKGVSGSFATFLSFLSFLGGTTQILLKTLLNPLKLRAGATLYHIEKNGLNALPIIALTSLLIGMVIAYQGAVQLEKFGANIFIVEMVGISATRELAPLIVAIVIAGRSASSFTAQLGVMKITEEVDAMRTLGFSEWEFLILPRVVALIVSLPLLVFFADIVAVFGGMIVARTELDVSFFEFTNRFQEAVALKHILIGLFKAPFFGWIIATIGCFRGFQITSSTESVGKYTTVSVVNAVFWVIAFDAVASIFLTQVGL